MSLGGSTSPNSDELLVAIQGEVDLTPNVPNWSEFVAELPSLGRRLIMASPCCGIHGSFHALKSMGVPTDSVFTYDLERGYKFCLEKQLLAGGMRPEDIHLHVGDFLGDLLKVPLVALRRHVDILVSGPPCPPWSNAGSKKTVNDVRAQIFSAF